MTQTLDPFDELAALFLTEPQPTSDGDADQQSPNVEVLLVGHLPVRASLWLTPYVDSLAREMGPTALLRLDDDEPSLQLLRPPEAFTPVPTGPAGCVTLRDAIRHLAEFTALWVVRPAGRLAARQVLGAGPDRITILSSADEAAIVAAYQLVKDLVETAGQAGTELPGIGLAVLGADRHTAQRMRQRLNRTTSTFLQVELALVACVQRMDAAVRAGDCMRFAHEPRPSIESVLGWMRDACVSAPQAQEPTEPPVQPTPTREEPRAASRVSTRESEAGDQRPAVPTPTIRLAPKPSVELEPKEPARIMEPDEDGAPVELARYVEGLTPLAVRCPGHERLELAVDSAGRLHVLAHEAQLRELHVVESWAKAHRELISMACPMCWIDPAGHGVRHIFTEQPATLADLHGCDLRLHVLAPVVVDGRRGWYAAPLNAAVR